MVRYKNIKQGGARHNCSQIQLILKINTASIYQIYMSDWLDHLYLAGGKNKGFDHAYFTTINNYPREFVMIFKSFTKRKFRNIELYNKNGGTVVPVNANFAFIWFKIHL